MNSSVYKWIPNIHNLFQLYLWQVILSLHFFSLPAWVYLSWVCSQTVLCIRSFVVKSHIFHSCFIFILSRVHPCVEENLQRLFSHDFFFWLAWILIFSKLLGCLFFFRLCSSTISFFSTKCLFAKFYLDSELIHLFYLPYYMTSACDCV